eukprot:TRINITY_DN17096_c0_g1_i1.p1 TRINITY_DN17096_c0_g1~~TRINITY_DN17096_c0_g1_i1.p1  ORF type:complete len:337 (-),score=32.12 TRINITY_DN17096_c0_g1_i1:6-950(-)
MDRGIVLKFVAFLDGQYALDNFDFWLEAQVYKYIRNQQQMGTMAQSIYERYLGPNSPGINIDDPGLKKGMLERVSCPTRSTFILIQNSIWGLLKLDMFPRFKETQGWNEPLRSKAAKVLAARYTATADLYDTFRQLNEKHPIVGGFKPNVIPEDFYEEHMHTIIPDIDELWRDKDLFLAFREYLYQQIAHEHLSFYLEAAQYEMVPAEKRDQRAKEIFDKFISQDAPVMVNLDYNQVSEIARAIANPSETTFTKIKEKVFKILENEWFPDFVTSPLYHACNAESITYTKSETRGRSDTLTYYDMLFASQTNSDQ